MRKYINKREGTRENIENFGRNTKAKWPVGTQRRIWHR